MKTCTRVRISGIAILLILICTTNFGLLAQNVGNPEAFLKGYNKYIKGEKFSYHSAQPNISLALLVRSLEQEMNIEWETEPIPSDFSKESASFIMMVAINVRSADKFSWDLLVDDIKRFKIETPSNKSLDEKIWPDNENYKLKFTPVMIDKFGDVHGYMYLTVPSSSLTTGEPLNIKVVGESANNTAFFIVYRYGMEPGIRVIPEQAIRVDGNNRYQQIRIEYTYMGEPSNVKIEAGNISTKSKIKFGYNSIKGRIPVVSKPTGLDVKLTAGKKIIAEDHFTVKPVTPRTIHLLHHSHVDIGYTHVQDEVEKIQWQHIENAIKYARESDQNPDGAKFRWNSEVMWAVESYLEEAPPDKVEEFKDAVRKGWIELNGIYAHMLSELCNTEELIRLTQPARKAAREIGVEIESAMITDVPGWSWGLVPVLSQSGIKYLSLGTNHGHRIGSIQDEWADRPFWWVSPSGEEKVLCWIHRNGYSMFHTGLNTEKMSVDKVSTRIFDYLNQITEAKYPYNIVPVRYSIGADNGPPDKDLSELVLEWNNMFETPRLRISTVSQTFSEFEKIYGNEIPSVSGAFTGYWEDGAASSAKMTGLNRRVADNTNIIGALQIINGGTGSIENKLFPVWRKITLYNEHTWGSWNSISDPENEFTLSQWAIKSSFARDAALESYSLKDKILDIEPAWRDSRGIGDENIKSIEVINPHSWNVTGAVEIPPAWNPIGDNVSDENGNRVLSQKLKSGHIYFIADDVPAMGSLIYYLNGGNNEESIKPVHGQVIENDMFLLRVNEKTGAIKNLFSKTLDVDLVNIDDGPGLNSYNYVAGRSPENVSGSVVSNISIIEKGDLISMIRIDSEGRGVNSITTYYTLVKGVNRVYVTNVFDKQKIYEQEGVHIGFPFNVPDGNITIDLALGAYKPGSGQAPGACMNYYTPERWVDISNQDYGLTLLPLDAHLIEIGEISSDPLAYGWVDQPIKSSTIYSYIMNNYWETNYLAAQEGPISFRYAIAPHWAFSTARAEKTSAEENERLVIIPNPQKKTGNKSLFEISSPGLVVKSVIPTNDGYLLRLFNAGGRPEALSIKWEKEPVEISFCDLDGYNSAPFKQGTVIPAWGLRTLKVKTTPSR